MASISNALSEALKTTIERHWRTYMGNRQRPLTVVVEEDISSVKVPAIGIFDAGSRVLFETMRGREADGTPKAGVVMQEYQFDLQIWVKGSTKAKTLTEMNEYRDGIKAILQDQYTLGEIDASISVTSDEPSLELPEASAILRVGMVRAFITTWSLQGSVELVNG